MMNSRREVWPLPIRLVLPIALGLIGCIAAQANGQLGGASYPGTGYRLTMPSFYEGEYGDALDGFRSAARSGLRSSQGRWVDSVCYHTMMGECFYHMGQLPQALEQYTVSLNLFMVNKDFLQRVKFAAVPIPKRRPIRPTITWGTTTRVSEPGDYSDSMPTMFGNFNAEQALQQGGIVAPPEFRNVDVVEILRCTALAMSRRRELLGPACQHDPLTTTLLAALGNRPGPVNHWSQTWVTVLLGMAEASAGHAPEAAALLQSSLVIGGRFDHPLTGLALLELGRLSYEQGQHAAALVLFLEASYAAAEYQQPDVMDEALRLGLASFLANGGNGAFPPLAPAAVWATRVKYRQLQASLLTSVAENLVAMRDAAGATRAIAAARQSMARSPMAVGEVGARLHFQNAINNFQLGNAAPGNASLTNAMTFQRHASRWLFHIVVADQLVTGGAITTHTADELYEFLLREPTTSDWTTNTWEALAVTLVPHVLPYEHWLEIAASRRDADRCLEIADALRRHRFYSSLPAGGRLLALRWLL
ncbi:MAG: tetratricopeptide repeat protein, partial [Planctomycetales bacterium]|nr:tetratricopeptide repeat protein [Planctomycetales bacterium]